MQSHADFSLEKYFDRIGLGGLTIAKPSLASLQAIITHHLITFHYENTALFNAGKQPVAERKVSSLQIDELFETMVNRRGGYCMQNLELLYAALSRAGFVVDRHLAKVFLQYYSNFGALDPDRAKSHELLIIHLDGKRCIVDVGMGSDSLRCPLELKEGETSIYDDQYRLINQNDIWALDTLKDKGWFRYYAFFDNPVMSEDIDQANTNLYFTSKHLRIRDDILFFGKTTSDKRKSLTWFIDTGTGVFKSVKRDSSIEKTKEITTLEDAYTLAEKKFELRK